MTGCCPPRGYDVMFGAKQARRDLKRWRNKGLTDDARDAVEFLAREPVATVLEIGGGIGAAQVELLRRGVERATNIELSPGYEEVALGLARRRGSRSGSSGGSGTPSPLNCPTPTPCC